MFVTLFLLIGSFLYIIISPPSVFSFTFISSSYSKHLYSHLPNVSRHLLPYIIRILTFVSRSFCNNFILKHLRNVPFELSPSRSRYFHVSISPNTYLKTKISHQKFVLYDNTLAKYNLIIHAVWSLLPSSQDKIDLTRVLATVESN
jgi:hypothetical protein